MSDSLFSAVSIRPRPMFSAFSLDWTAISAAVPPASCIGVTPSGGSMYCPMASPSL